MDPSTRKGCQGSSRTTDHALASKQKEKTMTGRRFGSAVSAMAFIAMLTLAAQTAHAQPVGLGEAIRNVTAELAAGMEQGSRIAIISVQSGSVTMSNHLVDEMTMAFVNAQRFLVVNRAQLELITAELHLNLEGHARVSVMNF